jgi:hypothetical protein
MVLDETAKEVGAALTVCSTDLLVVLGALLDSGASIGRLRLPPSEEANLQTELANRRVIASFDDTSEMWEKCLESRSGEELLIDLEHYCASPQGPLSKRALGKEPHGNLLGAKRAKVGQRVIWGSHLPIPGAF